MGKGDLIRLELQKHCDLSKTQAERNRLGQFGTPQVLASQLVRLACSFLPKDAKVRFLEPGFGTGPFYAALLDTVPLPDIESAVGYEIDPHYGEPARQLWAGTPLQLRLADFMTASPPKSDSEKFNLVVCNPPYVRHHHLGQSRKSDLQSVIGRYFDIRINGLTGLYAYFMIFSQTWMTPEGIGAWLVPSEFMDVNYGRAVKEFLLKRVTLQTIHRFDTNDVQFGDALVSSAVVLFRNAVPGPAHKVIFSSGGSLEAPDKRRSIGLGELERSAKWTSFPQLVHHARERLQERSLSSLFTIKRGLATGANNFFIITPSRAEELNLPKEFLIPILPGPRELAADEIEADAVGEPLIANRRYLLSCSLPADKVKSRYPRLWQYLETGLQAGIDKHYLCEHREPWYSQENRPPAPFLCTYMGRSTARSRTPFRFILNRSAATAANVYLMLYPRPQLADWLAQSPEHYSILWKALSAISSDALVGEGRLYGGGLHKLEPRELANVSADVLIRTVPALTQATAEKQLNLFAL